MFIKPEDSRESGGFSLELAKNLTGIVGVPAVLFAIGYLAEKSHFALLGLPTGLMSSTREHLFYDGALFLVLTLQTLVWHWSLILALAGGVAIYGAARWARKRVISRQAYLWVGLALFSIAISLIETPILTAVYGLGSSGTAAPDHAARLASLLWGGPDAAGQRQVVYRLISYASAALAAYLIALWRSERPTSESSGPAVPLVLRVLAVGLACLALLSWPACYGRLILPYERPLIEVTPKDSQPFTGFVLNPQGDVWSVWVRRTGGSELPQIRVFDVKSLPPFRIVRYADLFAP